MSRQWRVWPIRPWLGETMDDIRYYNHIYKWLRTFEAGHKRVWHGWAEAVEQIERVSGVGLDAARVVRLLKNLRRREEGKFFISAYSGGSLLFYYKDLDLTPLPIIGNDHSP